MKMRIVVAILAVVVVMAFAVSALAIHAVDEPAATTMTNGMPSADGVSLWNYIAVTKPYTKWSLWPGMGKLYKGQEPHGMLLTSYVSKDAKKVIKKKLGVFDPGAIIVKENYMPDKTLAAITVMYKVKDYDPDAGDWFWAKYAPDGTVQAQGQPKGCINCHGAKNANDWVFTGNLRKGPATDGAELYKYITETSAYTSWPLWPGKGKLYKGQEPHGMLLTTYVTRDAQKVIKRKKGMFKDGAIIVKENYKPDKTLAAITVMYKAGRYDPAKGDWFWVKYGPDGTVQAQGQPKGCINCHQDKKDNDWVFTGEIKKVKQMSGSAY